MKTNFIEMSFTDILITVLSVIVVILAFSFMLSVAICLGGFVLKIGVFALCITAIIYGVKHFKEKYMK